jgi:predicted RecB family nuclease
VTNRLTASLLYNHLCCPHRVFMDAFADPSLRDPVSPFVQMLWERGTIFERETIAGVGVPFTDLSRFRGGEKEAETRAAIVRGDTLIYSGRLAAGELLGEPDLLRKEASGYVAIDIKSGSGEEGGDEDEDGKPKKTYGVQLALYTDILERLGASAGRYGVIWDVHAEEIRYELDTPLGPKSPSIAEVYRDAKAAVERTLTQEQKTLPARVSACKQCVWGSSCLRDMKGAGDLSLLPQLGRAKRDALAAAFPTVARLASADLSRYAGAKKSPYPGVSAKTLAKLQMRAQLAVDPTPVPFFREAVELPTNPLEVFFDIEDDPMRDVVYLHGFVIRRNGDSHNEKFVAVFAEEPTAQDERGAFAVAWEFLRQHREYMVYYYSKHERTKYRKLQQKYPQVCSAEDVEALFSAGRSFDLLYGAVFKSEWPTLDWSIKSLAKFLKFQWRDADPSGAASIEWFDQWVKTQDPKIRQRILDYNEDDCRAMRVLLDAMRGMEMRRDGD